MTIPFWIIDQYGGAWQKHLERIADFLLEGCWLLEDEKGITFLDAEKNENTRYRPHHFRSYTIKEENGYVLSCWERCLQDTALIPAKIITDINNREHKINNVK